MMNLDGKSTVTAALQSSYWWEREAKAALSAWADSGLPLSRFARRHE